MADDQVLAALTELSTPPPLPGDIVQVVDMKHPWCGVAAMIEGVRSWGLGLMALTPRGGGQGPLEIRERVRTEQTLRVGAAAMMPPHVAEARRDALETQRQIAADQMREAARG